MNAAVDAPTRLNSPGYFASHWRSLDYFNLYRLSLALALVMISLVLGDSDLFKPGADVDFNRTAIAYLLCAALLLLGIRARWPGFQIQLTAHIVCDIVFVILMINASNRLASGLGLLLVISIASGGLVGSGRLALLYAALASIAVLLQHGFSLLSGGGNGSDNFLQIGVLCMGYFATGLLAHTLTRRALHSETLAAAQAQELALLNRINALAIENSPDGILAINADGSVRHANPRALSLLHAAPPLSRRTALSEFAPQLLDALQHCREGLPLAETTLVTPHARLRVRCIPLDVNTVLILEDLTQTEQAAQRMKLAALGRLTANIAHEIRNPLSAISHAAQLLHEDATDAATMRLIELIEKNSRRLDKLVEDVMSLNRRDRLHPQAITPATLDALLNELLETEEIPADAVIVDMHINAPFCFDPDHLRQILWNLLKNAWRHSRQQPGSVRVTLSDAAPYLYLDIRDDGAGIAADLQPRLFEPFFTTDSRGTGLGLFLARELCEANDATLTLLPRAVGARFRVTLRKGACA
jgi:two-component system sensor histidine kinase PilS (NtrC family)